MNFSPYNVLYDQQSLQSGQYLYMLNKISVFQGGKTALLFKLKCTIFWRKYNGDFEFFPCFSDKGFSHPYGVAMTNTGYGLAVPTVLQCATADLCNRIAAIKPCIL